MINRLKKYKEIWDRINYTIEKEFDSEPMHNGKFQIKSYNGKIKTDFHDSAMPKNGSHRICFLVILIDSIFEMGKNYYS